MTTSAEHGEGGDHGETSTVEANAAASTHQNALLEGISFCILLVTLLRKTRQALLRDVKPNIRRTLHIMDHVQNKNISAALISMRHLTVIFGLSYIWFLNKAVECSTTLYQRPAARHMYSHAN